MVKDIGIGTALGLISTLLLIFSVLGSGTPAGQVNALQTMSLMTLSVVPLFVAGLGWGLAGGISAVVTGALVAATIIAPLFSMTYVLTCGLPVLLITRQSLLWREENGKVTWYPTTNLVMIWVGVSILLSFMAIALLYQDQELRKNLITQFDLILPQLQQQGKMFEAITAEGIVRALPQFFGPFWGVILLLGGILAQGVLVRFKRNIRPSPVFQDLKLPVWMAVATVGVVGFNLLFNWGDTFLGAVILALEIAFFLQGIAVIHKVSKGWRYRPFILTAVYLSMFLIFWLVLVVALLGLVDSWVGFREKLNGHPDLEED
ncbi:DUF2232 domain-containing protein [Sneathiella limimaris]|uniref:DUF2232 domain-containing protein n=1 Tax=Sneathiella limimaris TaxID=1964213 RepID=UPI00146E38EF|nr:DUF2232 domain-containing protein [Sneathiella limimaris]